MKKTALLAALLISGCLIATAQVDDIKKASKENSSNKSSGSGGGSSDRGHSGGGNIFFFFDMFRVLGQWQQQVLTKRDDIPGLVGLDFMVQGSVQPSSYYVINPRVRGTWGIFSTDFRTNYMYEESIDGDLDLATYDWQIVQLNFINTKNVIVRAGTGFMKENYGGHGSFIESGVSSNLMFNENKWGGFAEFRSARDYNTNVVPRREFSLQVHKQLFESGRWHALATGGVQFQRYYSTINVWGIQMGLVFRLY